MKKYSPYIFPLIAMAIVAMLLYRWYDTRTENSANPVQFGEGVEIENLSENELSSVLRGAEDVQTVELTAPTQEGQAAQTDKSGVIRYDIVDDAVKFSVMAQLPMMTDGSYQVWLKDVDSEGMKKAFILEEGKGGMMGSASISTELLPFEVVVSKETNMSDEQIEEILLRGTIEKPMEASASPTPEVN